MEREESGAWGGEFLRKKREEMGLSVCEMARRMNVVRQSIYWWEGNAHGFFPGWIQKIRDGYGISEQKAACLYYEIRLMRILEGVESCAWEANRYTLSEWMDGRTYAYIEQKIGANDNVVRKWIEGEMMVGHKWLEQFAKAIQKTEADVAWASYKAHEGWLRSNGKKTVNR